MTRKPVIDISTVDKKGKPLVGHLAVRPIIDNSAGTEAMEDVRFKIAVPLANLSGMGRWSWDDDKNPWFGERDGVQQHEPNAVYGEGIAYYPPTQEWSPIFTIHSRPGHANYVASPKVPPEIPIDDHDSWLYMFDAETNRVELIGTVPAGHVWDRPMRVFNGAGKRNPIRESNDVQIRPDR